MKRENVDNNNMIVTEQQRQKSQKIMLSLCFVSFIQIDIDIFMQISRKREEEVNKYPRRKKNQMRPFFFFFFFFL